MKPRGDDPIGVTSLESTGDLFPLRQGEAQRRCGRDAARYAAGLLQEPLNQLCGATDVRGGFGVSISRSQALEEHPSLPRRQSACWPHARTVSWHGP